VAGAELQAIVGRNGGARVKDEVGYDAGDICFASGAQPCPLWRGLTVLGHSLRLGLSPPSHYLHGGGGG